MDLSNPLIIPDGNNPFTGLAFAIAFASAAILLIKKMREGNK